MAGRGRGALLRSALRRPGSAEKVLVVDLIISNIITNESNANHLKSIFNKIKLI